MRSHQGPKYAAISIDMDGLDCYHAIHGLAPPPSGHLVYPLGLNRFLDLLGELTIPATLFVITRDLEQEEAVATLRTARRAGHEIASHSHRHPYNLARMDQEEMVYEVRKSAQVIEQIFGLAPAGFRAPGYSAGDAVIRCVQEVGYAYDSSVFPCPAYYLAKAAIMAGMRLVGRPSGSSLTDPRALVAPLAPYRPKFRGFHRPAKGAKARPIWEIPVTVLPGLRLPVIGTSLTLMGSSGFRMVFPWLRRTLRFLNLEFHAIDLMDATDPGVDRSLAAKQPDLRRPTREKEALFRRIFQWVGQEYQFVTLEEMAQHLDRIDPLKP